MRVCFNVCLCVLFAGATVKPDEHADEDPASLCPLHHPQPREEGNDYSCRTIIIYTVYTYASDMLLFCCQCLLVLLLLLLLVLLLF